MILNVVLVTDLSAWSSISLELDFINLFTRLVQILALQQGRRK
jgi:FtsH-binding integral membrane protein